MQCMANRQCKDATPCVQKCAEAGRSAHTDRNVAKHNRSIPRQSRIKREPCHALPFLFTTIQLLYYSLCIWIYSGSSRLLYVKVRREKRERERRKEKEPKIKRLTRESESTSAGSRCVKSVGTDFTGYRVWPWFSSRSVVHLIRFFLIPFFYQRKKEKSLVFTASGS